MKVRAMHAHPAVRGDLGRVAIARGPLIYCAEEVDNAPDLDALLLPDNLEAARTTSVPGLDGAIAIELPARREQWLQRDGKFYDSRPWPCRLIVGTCREPRDAVGTGVADTSAQLDTAGRSAQ
jgi:DUF1680 family protein